jgi:hypothetical protein
MPLLAPVMRMTRPTIEGVDYATFDMMLSPVDAVAVGESVSRSGAGMDTEISTVIAYSYKNCRQGVEALPG